MYTSIDDVNSRIFEMEAGPDIKMLHELYYNATHYTLTPPSIIYDETIATIGLSGEAMSGATITNHTKVRLSLKIKCDASEELFFNVIWPMSDGRSLVQVFTKDCKAVVTGGKSGKLSLLKILFSPVIILFNIICSYTFFMLLFAILGYFFYKGQQENTINVFFYLISRIRAWRKKA